MPKTFKVMDEKEQKKRVAAESVNDNEKRNFEKLTTKYHQLLFQILIY
jgi:hypothetical protein